MFYAWAIKHDTHFGNCVRRKGSAVVECMLGFTGNDKSKQCDNKRPDENEPEEKSFKLKTVAYGAGVGVGG